MKIPKELKIKKFQYLFTNNGKRYFYKDNLLFERYQIIALLNRLIRYCDIVNYPFITEGIDKNKLIFNIKMYLLAEKMECMIYDFSSQGKLLIKDSKYIKEMILYKYLYFHVIDNLEYKKDISILSNNILQGIKKKDSKNGLLYRYLVYYFPDELKSKVDTQQQLNDVIETKYKLIKKYDNFASFNKFFNECYQTAENLIRENRNHPEFKKFYKKESKKIYPFRFNPCKSLINPLYSDDVVSDLEKFSKEIHLRPKHSLKL
jgi:hypothetical protein